MFCKTCGIELTEKNRPNRLLLCNICYEEKVFITKPCKYCGKDFRSKRSRNIKFCSTRCAHNSHISRITKDCVVCGKQFSVTTHKTNTAKYCSRDCMYKACRGSIGKRKGTNKACKVCGKEFYVKPSEPKTRKYCSRDCQVVGQKDPSKYIYKTCKMCGKQFKTYKSYDKKRNPTFCNIKCSKEWYSTMAHEKKKSKKGRNQKLKKQLWGIFSKYIRQRDKGKCISCGKQQHWRKTDAGHYIPKTAGLSIYFDEINVNCQCTYCNRFMHGNLSRYAIALQDKYGDDILRKLDQKRQTKVKFSDDDYLEMITHYKKKLKEVEIPDSETYYYKNEDEEK